MGQGRCFADWTVGSAFFYNTIRAQNLVQDAELPASDLKNLVFLFFKAQKFLTVRDANP